MNNIGICRIRVALAMGLVGAAVSSWAQSVTFTEFPVPTSNSQPAGIAAGPDGALWFTEQLGNKIGRITTAGVITEFLVPSPNSGPAGITAGPDGALWFTEYTGIGNKIGRITTAGVITEFPLSLQTFNSPVAITTGPDGALWFACQLPGTNGNVNYLGRITTSGTITAFPVPSPNSSPEGITAGPDGALWFTESGLQPSNPVGKIGRITTAGVITEFPLLSANSGPTAITAGPDGALWFTESGKFGNSASNIGRITTPGVVTEFSLPFLSTPSSITTGPDGALWFVETSSSKIGRITTAGVITQFSAPINSIQLNGITTGSDGALWFTDGTSLGNPGTGNRIGRALVTASPAPTITGLSPSSATAGVPAFTLTVNGSGFVAGSTVFWNNSSLTTTEVTANQLTASVSANLIANASSVSVTVVNPGGVTSNAMTFTINPPMPIISGLSPNSGVAGGQAFTLTVNGSGFLSASTVYWNGSALATSYGSGNQLSASVPANLFVNAGSASVTVLNPGGVTSNAFIFTINAPGLSIITASPLPVGTVGVPYSQALAATGGATPYKSWGVISGNLPNGLSLTTLGGVLTALLNGVPTTPGTFTFTVQVTDNTNATATKQFSLTINGGALSISAAGIVNAASYVGGSVAPGEIIVIFGSGLGPSTLVGLQLNSSGYVSTSLAGTQALFDGVAAPLIYTQAGYVSTVVPYEVSGKSTTQVQVVYQGQNSNIVSMPVSAVLPGIFTDDASGHGQGAIVNQDGTINSASNPASAGTYVFVYATGEGQTNPIGIDGKPGSSPAPVPITQPVTVTVGGLPAQVQYAGGVPGLVAGVLQVNVLIPSGVVTGNSVPIVINVGGQNTQVGVTLAIK